MDHIGVGTFTTTPRMQEYVNQVLASSRLSYGPFSQRFETEFAKLHGCGYGVLSNSGTSSLHVALQAMKELYGWNDGDEVIVPAVTFVATVNIVLHNNMRPVLVDVDPIHYELDPALIEAAITSRTRAIIPVHLFGQPCDMTAIRTIANAHGLRMIEDSCEAMYVKHASRPVGAWGDVACFSMYVAHLLTTGVGGIGITNDPALAAKMRSLVNHGRDGIYISIDDERGASGERLKEVISRRFKFESQGHSFRITELEAALGCAQLPDLPAIVGQRRANALGLNAALNGYTRDIQLPAIRHDTEHAFMMYPIVVREGDKAPLMAFLEENGIETREMLPLTNQPVYQSWCNEDDYPVAKWINQGGLYIGCHQDLTYAQLVHIRETFARYFAGA